MRFVQSALTDYSEHYDSAWFIFATHLVAATSHITMGMEYIMLKWFVGPGRPAFNPAVTLYSKAWARDSVF